MDDLDKVEADLTAGLWKQIERIERHLATLRNALQQAGPGSSATMVAEVVAEDSLQLLKIAAQGEAHADAVRMM